MLKKQALLIDFVQLFMYFTVDYSHKIVHNEYGFIFGEKTDSFRRYRYG